MATKQVFDTIFERVAYRKVYHFVGGLILCAGVALMPVWWFVGGCALFAALFWLASRRIAFAVMGIPLVWWVTASRFTALGAAIIWLAGDGLSAVVGSGYGKRAWRWNASKTVEGSAAGFAAGFAASAAYLFASADGAGAAAWAISALVALAGSIIETLPLNFLRDVRANDNLTVQVGVGLLFHLLTAYAGLQPA